MTERRPPHLFRPFTARGLTLKNRVVISPMCQHAADFGRPGAWHMVHLGKFALGGAGLILVESTAVEPEGRIGLRDVGLWSDELAEAFRPIVDFVHDNGAAIGVQLAHAGRKAGSEALWEGGRPLTPAQLAATGEPWRRIGPSALAAGPSWSVPEAMTPDDIRAVTARFAAAARRADRAGFDVVELHFGHGYLVASFLSPLANRRDDDYGGPIENRMRLALEVAGAVRAAWPAQKPLFVRISAVDGAEGGWSLDDSVVLAHALKAAGVDVIDCSSGGLADETRAANVPRGLGFQVPFAERIRRDAGVPTQAVGVIVDAAQAEAILAEGRADLVAIGRQALYDPYWPHHAADALGWNENFSAWPLRHGGWLDKRARALPELGGRR